MANDEVHGKHRHTRRRLTAALGAGFSLVVFTAALYALYRALHDYQAADILEALRRIPPAAVAVSLVATAGSYLALSGFDWLALRYIRRSMPLRRVILASFVSHAVSHSTGFGALTGGAIRYRIYSTAGLSVLEVAGVVLFCGVTFTLGASTLAAVTLAIEPAPFASVLRLPVPWVQAGALLTALAIAAYVLLGGLRRRPLCVFGRALVMPRPRTAATQVAVAAADLSCAAAALYLLLPSTVAVSYPAFVGIFVLANLAGIMAHVPGGLGVFETTVIFMVPSAPADEMFGALVVFRVVYFLLPLLLGTAFLALHEATVRAREVQRATVAARLWARELQPPVAAAVTYASGALLFYVSIIPRSATSPLSMQGWTADAIGLVSGLLGVMLLVLARALHRRQRGAYVAVVTILVLANLLVIARGGDYGLAAGLALVAVLLAVMRRAFYRRTPFTRIGLSAPWMAAVLSAFLGGIWLMMVDSRSFAPSVAGVDPPDEGDGAHSLHVVVGGGVILLGAGMAQVVWRRRRASEAGRAAELPDIIHRSPSAMANLAYRLDVERLYADSGDALILFRRHDVDWVAIGEPIGAPGQWVEMAWRFRECAEAEGGRPVFWNVPYRPLYLDLGLSFLRIGEEASLDISRFGLDDPRYNGLRRLHEAGARNGLSFEVPTWDEAAHMLPELTAVAEAWWQIFGCRPPSFDFDLAAIRRHRVAVVRRDGTVAACALVWASGDGKDLAADLVRCRPDSPPGTEDYLLAEMLIWGRQRGHQSFDLGLAPCAETPLQGFPDLGPILPYVCHRGPGQPHGPIKRWQEAFRPRWRPRYMAVPAELALRTGPGSSAQSGPV